MNLPHLAVDNIGFLQHLLFCLVPVYSLFSTWPLCWNNWKMLEQFLLVRREFFRLPILTNHVIEFLFSLRVARTKSPSEK